MELGKKMRLTQGKKTSGDVVEEIEVEPTIGDSSETRSTSFQPHDHDGYRCVVVAWPILRSWQREEWWK